MSDPAWNDDFADMLRALLAAEVRFLLPPSRIDVRTAISGVDFDAAWAGRVMARVDDLEVPFIGPRSQLTNKRATGREKDLVDANFLASLVESGD